MNSQWGHLNGLLPLVFPTRELYVDESKFGDDDDDDGSEPTEAEKLNMLVNDGNEDDDRLSKKLTVFHRKSLKGACTSHSRLDVIKV